MRPLSLLRHRDFLEHKTPLFHPETAKRLTAIDDALAESALNGKLVDVVPRAATDDEICSVHTPLYVEQISKRSKMARDRQSLIQLDPDTYLSAASFEVAKLAAGAGLEAVKSVTNDRFLSSFVAVRPPGHHASASEGMGFCLFNNIALAARYAREHLGYHRVMIIDWDVHHGNGTQEIFYESPDICFLSLHQYPFWPPNSGWFTEDGKGAGRGYNINVPLPAGTGDAGYLLAWQRVVQPICREYKPDLILLSAGYDAHADDPLGEQDISTCGFASMAASLVGLSKETNAKIVCFLEGGYNTHALADSVVATMRVLSAGDESEIEEIIDSYQTSQAIIEQAPAVSLSVEENLESVRKHFSQYWKML
jgi:acetoin utilization deacetylase AcuC-like enzyme